MTPWPWIYIDIFTMLLNFFGQPTPQSADMAKLMSPPPVECVAHMR